jgi:hypothetical protein
MDRDDWCILGRLLTEVTVRRRLMRQLQTQIPDALAIRYEDRYTRGIPDLSISWRGQTSFWEIKYADPHCVTSKVQHYLCDQLDTHGFHCRYIIFQRGIPKRSHPRPRQIRIVKPTDFDHWAHLGLVVSDGRFDYDALVDHIEQVHQ